MNDFKVDGRVISVKSAGAPGWDRNFIQVQNRRWGVLGTVTNLRDSHGIVVVVQHDDGAVACYEPCELQRVVLGRDMPHGSVGITVTGNFPGRWVQRMQHEIVSNDRSKCWQYGCLDEQVRIVSDSMPDMSALRRFREMPEYIQAQVLNLLMEAVDTPMQLGSCDDILNIRRVLALAPKPDDV